MRPVWNELELSRRLVHLSGVILPLAYLGGLIEWRTLGVLLLIGVLTVTVLEVCRLALGFTHVIYDRLTRPYEQHAVAGYALYLVGMAGAWVLAPPAVAIAAMLMLSVGDPVSGVLSSATAGETKPVPVLLAMFVTCLLVAVPVTAPALGLSHGAVIAAVGAIGATVSDGAKPTLRGRIIDDNLTIPLVSSLCMTMLLLVL